MFIKVFVEDFQHLLDFPSFQQQLAAATALAQKGDLPAVGVPVHLPPPNFNQVTVNYEGGLLLKVLTLAFQGYDGPRGGYQNNHHNHHMDRPPPGYDGHNRGHHNNFNNRFGFVTNINNSHTQDICCRLLFL